MPYSPPFQLTHTMMRLVAEISELIGNWTAHNRDDLQPQLRRENRIRTIQASLAIEQNTLTLEQVTAVIEGKPVLGHPKEIQEVHNALETYAQMPKWSKGQANDLLNAHRLLMKGLLNDAGQWRSGGAGIYRGEQLVHMAPPANQIPRLMHQLLEWLETTDAHPLIASAAFHYEFEFIHPFSDGNGRMGRLWQTLILSEWQPLLAYLPVETVIKSRQEEYYQAFREADEATDCSHFIEFLLQALATSLQEAISNTSTKAKVKVEMTVKMKVKPAEQIIDLLAKNGSLTLSEVAVKLELSKSTVERAVAKLKKEGKLEYVGPRKGGYWRVM
ncbi:Fic family protein [Vibrio rumoiensis]|uniref:Cell filamentation protein Fic n=1 Tax=Vibrio rumoiensis 1S-45 TaxID=1188252 RepID=A0A1E5E4H1_9VIBR|nr:Fic family protein [Vibrio rumoiensis]OEF27730.1 cell filamentation protein Fic [Vibrio rumoiensis 1S-45]